MSLWPNTEMNTVSASGGLNLPGRSHATAFVSVASMTNNNPLLPFTDQHRAGRRRRSIAPNSDVTARVTAMNYTFTSRPVTTLWFSARYRQYDFDNRTVPFWSTNSVNYDTAIVALNKSSEPFGSTRHTFDADATYSPICYVGFRAGYTREDDRSHLPHRREDDRGHRARVGGPDRPRLDDGARRVRALQARRHRRSIGWNCWRSASSRRCASTTSRTATRIASTPS